MECSDNTAFAINNASSTETNCSTHADIIYSAIVYERGTVERIFGTLVTLFIISASVIGNLAVVLVSSWNEALRVQPGNYLIVYLSIVDMLTAIFVMIPSALSVAIGHWPMGGVFCTLHAYLHYLFTCSSSETLAAISIDRIIAVYLPLRYRALMTKRKIALLCSLNFVISSCMAMLGILNPIHFDYAEGICVVEYTGRPVLVHGYNSAVCFCFYIPSSVIAICYTMIIVSARRGRNAVYPLANGSSQNSFRSMKIVKSMMTITVAYYVAFTPYSLLRHFKVFSVIAIPPWSLYLSTIFLFFSSAVNPFFYAILRKDYRNAFKQLPRDIRNNLF